MRLEKILVAAVRGGASDVIFKIGAVPHFRYLGKLVPLENGQKITREVMEKWVSEMTMNLSERLVEGDVDFAYHSLSGHRFRVNVFRQRGEIGMVLRVVLGHTRTLEELQMPNVIGRLADEKRGIILITGATGCGKSTTMAAIIDRINRTREAHIVTIEDPIEYLFEDQKSIIEQREVGIDTKSFSSAVRSAMRQNPDVIMIGELRDQETVSSALQAAETGHLVMATMHTSDAIESVQRILNFFHLERQPLIRSLLSQVLKAVISQRLVTRKNGMGMVAVMEVLIGSPLVKEVVEKGEFSRLRGIIKEGRDGSGMQTFDQSLAALHVSGMISREDARKYATSPAEMDLMLSGVS